ncbi:MAG: alpha/beta hydrolase [Micromonosporaceae bacterium]|nr:alpha/beta hydrolase [Micromonosporaceae bacterium]
MDSSNDTREGYLELNGVRTWYDIHGEGEPVVLLHGGLSDSRESTGNLARLSDAFRVYRYDRRAHGRTPDPDGPLSIRALTDDLVAFLRKVVDGPANLVGYSAGGPVALQVAIEAPDLVYRLVLISTAYEASGMLVTPDPDGQPPPAIVDMYGEVSPDGAGHFPVVLRKVAEGMAAGPWPTEADLAGVRSRTLVMASDDDIVSLEHTIALYRAIPDAELAIVPGTSHVLTLEKPELCTRLVRDFLTNDRGVLIMPIRR